VPLSGTKALLVRRDAAGKAQVETPISTDPPLTIANRDYVDIHINVTTGAHGATSEATANRLVARDGNGKARVATPGPNDHIETVANGDYVDTGLGNHTHNYQGQLPAGTAGYLLTYHGTTPGSLGTPKNPADFATASHTTPAATTAAVGHVRLATASETVAGATPYLDKTAAFSSGATIGQCYRNASANSTFNILGVSTSPGDVVKATSSSAGTLVTSTSLAVTPQGLAAATADLIVKIEAI